MFWPSHCTTLAAAIEQQERNCWGTLQGDIPRKDQLRSWVGRPAQHLARMALQAAALMGIATHPAAAWTASPALQRALGSPGWAVTMVIALRSVYQRALATAARWTISGVTCGGQRTNQPCSHENGGSLWGCDAEILEQTLQHSFPVHHWLSTTLYYRFVVLI